MANDNLVIEDANVVFRNFAGKEGMYNAEGQRNFCVILDEGPAQDMAADGWNIKHLKAREEGDIPTPYVQVSVGYKGRPPRLVLITSRGKTELNEDEAELLDWIDIGTVDLIIRPYNWSVNGKTGVKAYLKSIFVTVDESALDLKYADVPMLDSSGQQMALEGTKLAIESGDNDIIDAEYEIIDA